MNPIDLASMVLAVGAFGFVCFDAGLILGKKRQDRDREDRLKSMRNHPSNRLRVKD